MIDEMSRSISQLQLSNLDKPYFIQYIVLDEDEFAARATFGAFTQSSPSKQRLIYSQVRVGNYDFDNTEFQAGGQGGAGGGSPGLYQGPVDDDYDSLRHTLWLATDASYKAADRNHRAETRIDPEPDPGRPRAGFHQGNANGFR